MNTNVIGPAHHQEIVLPMQGILHARYNSETSDQGTPHNYSKKVPTYRISPCISRGIYPRTKYYTDNSSYTRVTPSGKKLYRKQVEF